MSTLYRSRRDRMVTGLCAGVAESLGISTGVVRLLTAVSIPFTGGTTLFIYFIAALVVPKEPYDPYQPGGWQGGVPPHFDPNASYQGQQQYNPKRGPFSNFEQANQRYGNNGANGANYGSRTEESHIDSMMEDIEKKAMKKELEELRQKINNLENKKGDL